MSAMWEFPSGASRMVAGPCTSIRHPAGAMNEFPSTVVRCVSAERTSLAAGGEVCRASAATSRTACMQPTISASPLVDQARNQRSPSCLMRGAQAFAGVAVEIFEKEDEIPPMRIVREDLRFARAARPIDRAVTFAIRDKEIDHAVGEPRRQAAEREHLHFTISAGSGHADAAAKSLLQFSERLDDEKARRKPNRAAPVAVAAFEPLDRLCRLVANRGVAEDEGMISMRFAQAPHSVWRKELFAVDHPGQQRFQLILIDDREHVCVVAVAVHRRHAAIDDLAPVLEKPLEVLAENIERLDPLFLEALDGVERNEAYQRAHAKRNSGAVGESQQIVEKAVLGVPQRLIAADHLHGGA